MVNGEPQHASQKYSDDISAQYVLAELAHLHSAMRDTDTQGVQRVNLHVAFVSGVGALIFFLWERMVDQAVFILASALLFGVLIIGLLIYAEMVHWVIVILIERNRGSTIRRYFEDRDPDLTKYFGPVRDNVPFLVHRRTLRDVLSVDLGSKQIVTALNNLVAVAVGACVTLSFDATAYLLASIVGLIAFLAVWALQYSYARMRYRLIEETYQKVGESPRPETDGPGHKPMALPTVGRK